MRIGQVIGTVTLSRSHPALAAGALKLVVPYSWDELKDGQEPRGEELVMFDAQGAGVGQRVLLSEGPEAAQPLRPRIVPIDAYNAGMIDDIHLPKS